MKIKYDNQIGFVSFLTPGLALNGNVVAEMAQPILDGNDAIILKKVSLGNISMAMKESSEFAPHFEWGVSGLSGFIDLVGSASLIQAPKIMAYSAKIAEIASYATDNLPHFNLKYGYQDQIVFKKDEYGFLEIYPAKRIYVGIKYTNLGAVQIPFRIQYDIVTLSSNELLELYSSGVTI